jgi:NDP-sugar pyrophosphorylase family protein
MVLAAGQGTRLKSLGLDVPKALVAIGGKPLLAHQLEYLGGHGVSRVVVNAHHRADLIEAFAREHHGAPEIRVVVEPQLLGTAGGVRNALPHLGPGRFVVLYGDVLIDQPLAPLMRLHERSGAAVTVTAYATTDTADKGTVEVDDQGFVVRFVEKEPPTGREALVNAGLYVVERSFAERIPIGEPADFGHDVFPRALGDGIRIALFKLDTPVLDVGTPETLAAARSRYRR